jgi:hypothetical protein
MHPIFNVPENFEIFSKIWVLCLQFWMCPKKIWKFSKKLKELAAYARFHVPTNFWIFLFGAYAPNLQNVPKKLKIFQNFLKFAANARFQNVTKNFWKKN